MKSYLALIIGMTLVTYIPRLLPLVAMSDKALNNRIERFLKYIPYTALGALIIPGVVQATPEMPAAALIGIGATALISWMRGGLILPVVASIAATFLALSSFAA